MRNRALIVLVVVLASLIVALVAGMLRASGGSGLRVAIEIGAVAFAGSTTLGLTIMNSMRLL